MSNDFDEDIVTRLRREAAILPDEVWHFLNPLLLEAAAEIEKLREANGPPLRNDTP